MYIIKLFEEYRDHMRKQGLPVEGGIAGGYSERGKHVIIENDPNKISKTREIIELGSKRIDYRLEKDKNNEIKFVINEIDNFNNDEEYNIWFEKWLKPYIEKNNWKYEDE